MNDIDVMKPLYPPEGAPVCGYVCRASGQACKTVTRTKRGMWTHLRIVHKVRKQATLAFDQPATAVVGEVEARA